MPKITRDELIKAATKAIDDFRAGCSADPLDLDAFGCLVYDLIKAEQRLFCNSSGATSAD